MKVPDQRGDEPTTEGLFQLLWDDLVDVLGSSATATLLRRAAKHAARDQPTLGELLIHRPRFEYEYQVPATWKSNGRATFVALVRTLVPLLEQLTGPILVQRLRQIPQLASAGVLDDPQAALS